MRVSVQMGGGVSTRLTPYGWRTARSRHPGGVNMGFGDGSTRFIQDGVDLEVWRSLSRIEGEQVVAKH